MPWRKFLAIFYWAILIYLLFFAFFRQGTNTEINLIPFKSISELTYNIFVLGNDWTHWIINVIGNIVVFIPILPSMHIIFQKRISFLFAFLLGMILPILVEVLQYVFQIGSADIDDFILNFIGLMLGYFLFSQSINSNFSEPHTV